MPASLPVHEVPVRDGVVLGRPELVLIAGPCVIESEDHALALGRAIADIARRVGVPYHLQSVVRQKRIGLRSGRIADLESRPVWPSLVECVSPSAFPC